MIINENVLFEISEKFNGSEIFAISLDNEPEKTKHWFRMTEVCQVLGFKNTKETSEIHLKDWQYRQFKIGAGRPATYVCLTGLFRLCLRSKSPLAVEFQDWITEDVLIQIYQKGGYINPKATQSQLEALQKQIEDLQKQMEKAIEDEHRRTVKEISNFLPDPRYITDRKAYLWDRCQALGVVIYRYLRIVSNGKYETIKSGKKAYKRVSKDCQEFRNFPLAAGCQEKVGFTLADLTAEDFRFSLEFLADLGLISSHPSKPNHILFSGDPEPFSTFLYIDQECPSNSEKLLLEKFSDFYDRTFAEPSEKLIVK